MTGYSIATLRWGMEHCHDRNVAAGAEPFAGVDTGWWAATSKHPEETVLCMMEQIRADRLTRIPPNAIDDSYD